MREKKNYITTAVRLLLLVSLCIIVFSGYKLREISQIYKAGDQSYNYLKQQVRYKGSSAPNGVNEAEAGAEPAVDIPPVFIDFNLLKKVNADAAAWLYSPDTVIDYPVMLANDYDWYLHHLPDGTENANGSLFLDYNCPQDFSSRLNIIYGHHMKSGQMFSSLKGYKEQSYYEQHPYLYLYTEDQNYRIDLKYGCVIDAGEWRNQAYMYEVNLESLLACASSKTTFHSNAEYTNTDKFVVLTTCSYEFDDARYIVIGVMQPEFGSEVNLGINDGS